MRGSLVGSAIAVGAFVVIGPAARAQTGCCGFKNSADAVNSAMDPAATPPIRDLTFADPGEYAHLGPPGPYYPEMGVRMGGGGVVVINCLVKRDGRLNACRVLAETPTSLAFGLASLRMAETGYMRAKPPEDAASGDAARFVVIFPKLRR